VMGVPPGAGDAAIWDEVENGSYSADLALWSALAAVRGPVLELGCGSGRVTLALARLGHEVWGLDNEPELTQALRERAEAEGLAVHVLEADARSFDLGREFGLVLAPMQFAHVLGGSAARAAMLRAIVRHLAPDGLFAAALLTSQDQAETWQAPAEVPLPDVRERDAWVFSSLPLGVVSDETGLTIERLRQVVSPSGELTDERHTFRLDALEPEDFESEARAAGLEPAARREIPRTQDHAGSTAVILRPADG
jgi:SAM-dependent methyltransferase